MRTNQDEPMLRRIENLFNRILSDNDSQKLGAHDIEIASAALLVHCAKADGEQSLEEMTHLRSLLSERFELSKDEIESVIEAGEARERDAIDLHRFTRVLHENLDRDERIQMVRMLWEIADADGRIDHDEQQMVSLTARLLDVQVHDAVAARRAVQAERR